MPQGLDTQSLTVDPTVAPVVLAVMFVAFLVGAVGPFALCVLGSIRDERAMRRHAAEARAAEARAAEARTAEAEAVETPAVAPVTNPVAPTVAPAAVVLHPTVAPATPAPANDVVAPASAVRS